MQTTKVLTRTGSDGKKTNVMVYPPKFLSEAKQEHGLLSKHASDDQTFELEDVQVYEKPKREAKADGEKAGRKKADKKS